MLSSPLRESLPDHASVGSGSVTDTWPTLLVVDENAEMLNTLVIFFEKRGFHVAPAGTFAEAKEIFQRRRRWTMIIADYHLPDGTGWELCCWVRDRLGDAQPFVLMSSGVNCAAFCPGVDLLMKPFPVEELEQRVRSALRLR